MFRLLPGICDIVPLSTCDSVYFRFKKSRSLTAVRRGRDRVRDDSCSTGPDAGGEGLDGVEAEFFVELDGGAVF